MSTKRAVRVFAWLGMVLVFVFIAVSVDARGGRGGGGRGGGGRGGGFGGSRSVSRSGPASHGSYRTQRPSSRPSYQRPSAGQRPSTGTRPAQRPATQPSRPTTQPARPGTQPARPEAQPSRPTTKPAERPSQRPGERPGGGEDRPDRDDAREDWQQHRDDMQQDRQDWANAAREDWQEYAEWDEGGGYWIGGWYGPVVYHDDVDDWAAFVVGLSIGTALSSAAYHSMQSETKCQPTEVVVNQITYLKCGSNWYNRVMQGGTVSYVVVAAPAGF